MSKSIIKIAAVLALSIGVVSCMEQKEPLTKEVIKEVYKPTDVQVLKAQYDLQVNLFSKNLKDISDTEADKRINNSNSLAWIAGHTVDIQYNLAMLLGQATENPYAGQFGFGKPFDEEAEYPSLSQMQRDLDVLIPKISEALSSLTEEQLDAKAPFPIPFPEQTMRGLYAFQMHHLGYELGQIGLYRKFLGKSAFSYQ
ncbi:DinB family protein [uncultured Aquimarina sp.]|uniref:DinB family protein n=1 Tax=uncultured Aquimarina sp. TaxID=575652 RepID=UPI0026258D28|nr:DinB family protein [uncultured Aquimarina sp.]